jgi:hypothetical protein
MFLLAAAYTENLRKEERMRGIVWGFALWITAAGAAWPAVPSIALRDDLGERIASSLEVCFRTDLRADCVELGVGDDFTPPDRLLSLRVEGPDHGPASFQAADLKAGEDGGLTLRVPRKALLQIDKLPAEGLSVALYDKGAASFDKPLTGARGVGPAGVKIPAGEFLIALSSGRKAPDLHRLAVQPGSVARLEYQPRDGWSLVVRSRGAKTGKPVSAAAVSLESVPGYGAPNRPVGEGTTGADGLALFPGLGGRRIDAGVRHSEFLPQTVLGLSAAPGALALRDVALEEGGRVRARVRVKGQARQGAVCKLKDVTLPTSPAKDWPPPVLYEGRTDRQGVCRTGRFPAGTSYLLEVLLTEGGATLKRPIVLENGVEAEEELSLSEIRVRGTVTRGGEPVPGLTVTVLERQENLTVKLAEAKSGKDGTYEVTLAKPGRFNFVLRSSPESWPLIARSVAVEEEEKKTVDFPLERASVRGKVVDEEGKPVKEAWVTLYWRAAANEAHQPTDERGEFEFLLESPSQGGVEAEKEGYRKSERQELVLEDQTELPPFVLVLAKEKAFRGTLSSAAGLPVAGGWVASLRSHLGDEAMDYNQGHTDATGRFEVSLVGGRQNRLFASGPGCPLSFFDPVDGNGELALRCQGRPAVLDITLTDAQGRPVPNAWIILRQGSVIIPRGLLFRHLEDLGLRAETDASGRLVVPNLAPGDYDIFIANPVSEGMIEAGSRTGYLTTTRLSPLATAVLRLTVVGR